MRSLPADASEFFKCWCRNPRFALESSTHIRYKSGRVGPWRFNPLQEQYYYRTYRELAPGIWRAYRLLNAILKTRQYGQTTLEIGLLFHQWATTWGFTAKVIAYRDKTAAQLKRILNLFYESAWQRLEGRGLNPAEYLPIADLDNQHELYCERTGGCIEFTTQKARGSGRSGTLRRIYWTEFSEADDVADVMSGYGGSLTEDAPVTVDFTGKGMGNMAYQLWNEAWGEQGGENPVYLESAVSPPQEQEEQPWFNAHFYGRNDFDYSPEFLERQRRLLGKHFEREYPATPEEAFAQDDSSLFDGEDVKSRIGEQYLCQQLEADELKARIYTHGVDTAEGIETGNYSVIKTYELETGQEACPPYRAKVGPEALADEMAARLTLYPGLVVPERNNHGHTFILAMRNKGLGDSLYKHPVYDSQGRIRQRSYWKYGWPTDSVSKPLLEEAWRITLRDGPLVMVSPNGIRECREYCQRPDGKTGHPLGSSQGGDKFYDDEQIAQMLARAPEAVRQASILLAERHSHKSTVGAGQRGPDGEAMAPSDWE